MSNQSWIRRSSPSSSKSGPLKATLPVSSLTRQNSNLRQHSVDNSPITLSPTSPWRTRASPEQIISGIRSPGALNYRGKCHFSRHSIRRTASLDTIYLSGQWPRDFHASLLHLDKATQTEELDGKKGQLCTPDVSAVAEDKLNKMIRQRLLQRQQSNSRDNILQSRPRAVQEHSSQTTTPPPLRPPSRSAPGHSMRSSTEGLNQEIERLVLRAMSSLGGCEGEEEKAIQITPEGHRAPLPDLLRLTRTVNTQTPSSDLLSPDADKAGSKHLSPVAKLSPDSPASLSPPLCDSSRHTLSFADNTRHISSFSGRNLSPCGRQLLSSGGTLSSPHFVALSPKALDSDESPEAEEMRGLGGGGGGSRSPKINRFLAREPPDGCERVSLKFTEDNSSKVLTVLDYSDLKPSATFQLRPSAGSAFLPLSAPSKTPADTPSET